ncbi:glycosyltransferase family 2 protein [Candidatus Aenigmatarchaeota archaeon]
MPKVAIITPTYNRDRLLPKTMVGVARQNYDDYVHIIVDDASTDDTPQVVGNFTEFYPTSGHVKYVRRERTSEQVLGASAARNRGIKTLSEFPDVKYVTFFDDDDILAQGSLRCRVEALDANSEIRLVYGYLAVCTEDMRVYDICKGPNTNDPREIPQYIIQYHDRGFPSLAIMFRREFLDDLGGYDVALGHGEDLDFSIRAFNALKRGQFLRLPRKIFYYRKHEGGMCQHNSQDDDIITRQRAIFNNRHGITPIEEGLSGLRRFATRPHTFLPEPIKAALRPLRNRFSRNIGHIDPFVAEIERDVDKMLSRT